MAYWIRSSEWLQPIYETKDMSMTMVQSIKTLELYWALRVLCSRVLVCVFGNVILRSAGRKVLFKATWVHEHEHDSQYISFPNRPIKVERKNRWTHHVLIFMLSFLHLMPDAGQPKPWKFETSSAPHTNIRSDYTVNSGCSFLSHYFQNNFPRNVHFVRATKTK